MLQPTLESCKRVTLVIRQVVAQANIKIKGGPLFQPHGGGPSVVRPLCSCSFQSLDPDYVRGM